MFARALTFLFVTTLCATSFTAEKSNIPTKLRNANDIPKAFFNYIEREEPAYKWEIHDSFSHDGVTTYPVELTSQTWQGLTWKHWLYLIEPDNVRIKSKVLLFVSGGSNGSRPNEKRLKPAFLLAKATGARIALLTQVPNQPLFDGKKEDDLITETWLRYLKTGDETWPLLFPMAKSAVKAMDAIQEIVREKQNVIVDGFVITGASKRGWTSWLTPVVDQRIIATAPIVIDVLNFRKQMKHQIATWGKYSEQIIDYTSKGLIVEGKENVREKHLRLMMDPYTYRQQIMIPKLLINGTNDPYWVVDAMRLYWSDLVGPKYILQVPNAGHNLGGGVEYALQTLGAFFIHAATGKQLPNLQWDNSSDYELTLSCSEKPDQVRVWSAYSENKDFRNSKWSSKNVKPGNTGYATKIKKPVKGHVAYYMEAVYTINQIPYSLCTLTTAK
ncbi:MAG: PhoPQ-activated pathogenicity-related family protein [Planctomycetes bacterium]|nr:PhoPQ-activated pathogenicity-related family protein [Planctomycetota bacterium]MCH9725160.1 PhoPQ-activated pathogenicity-related family protein [Planctomycetota bacterium]MCH9775363.1 PhoPQ-activated pathogenicity-related family protein [Planctomycetota bacterium]MCH9790633.1 PhoPQ-activated pathogenicity-related family protein [Planctomycetota bacterium]